MVRGAGLEPASLAAKDPKSFAFANFASRALVSVIKYLRNRYNSTAQGDHFPRAGRYA